MWPHWRQHEAESFYEERTKTHYCALLELGEESGIRKQWSTLFENRPAWIVLDYGTKIASGEYVLKTNLH